MITLIKIYLTPIKKDLRAKVNVLGKVFSLSYSKPVQYKNISIYLTAIDLYAEVIKISVSPKEELYTLKVGESTHSQSIRYILED